MQKKHSIIMTLSLIALLCIIVLTLNVFQSHDANTIQSESANENIALKLTGQLYEGMQHGSVNSVILHLNQPLQLSDQFLEKHDSIPTTSIEYLSLNWDSTIGLIDNVGSVVEVVGTLSEPFSGETYVGLNVTDMSVVSESPIDDVLNESDIVGMVAENARMCGVGTGIDFFLPNSRLVRLYSGSEPGDVHFRFDTWTLAELSSVYKFPYKTEHGNSWSDGSGRPGAFYPECSRTLHSSLNSLHDLSIKTIDKYFQELPTELQTEILQLYPDLNSL